MLSRSGTGEAAMVTLLPRYPGVSPGRRGSASARVVAAERHAEQAPHTAPHPAALHVGGHGGG